MTESVLLDEVFEMLGRIRVQVQERLSHLCEANGAYLNVDHVRLQLAQLDTILDQETIVIANMTQQPGDGR